MKRRTFLGVSAGTGAAAAGLACGKEPVRKAPSVTGNGKLAGKTFEELRDEYYSDLFNVYLPYLNKYVVDHEHGGFMCNTHPDGTHINTDKRAWYEGRGIWVYSYLYNKIDPDPGYLDIARKTTDFVVKLKPDRNTFWPGTYTREGKPLTKGAIFCDLFVALGLQEYSKVPGNERYRNVAKEIMVKCIRIYDSPEYPGKTFRTDVPDITAPRLLAEWMIMTRVLSQMLETGPDTELEAILERCIDAVMNRHYNPEYGLMNEVLNHDFSRPDNFFAQWSYTGHAIEVFWFIMDEALRRKDRALFDAAAERFMRHIEVSWDDVYTGLFRSLDNVDKNIWMLDVILLFQLEGLIGTIMLVEHTGSSWSKEWYAKIYAHIRDKYEIRKFGYSPWMRTGDRTDKEEYSYGRVGNYHYPQAIMLNLLALERMIARNGKISNHFV